MMITGQSQAERKNAHNVGPRAQRRSVFQHLRIRTTTEPEAGENIFSQQKTIVPFPLATVPRGSCSAPARNLASIHTHTQFYHREQDLSRSLPQECGAMLLESELDGRRGRGSTRVVVLVSSLDLLR